MPVLSGYPDWCERCGWNLKAPPRLEPPAGRFTRLARALGRRSGERLARELLRARELEPRWTPAKVAAYAIAIAVHVATLWNAFWGVVGARRRRVPDLLRATPAYDSDHLASAANLGPIGWVSGGIMWLLLWSAVELVVQQAVHDNAPDVLDRRRLSLQLVPDRERERRRRVARLEEARLEDTHPPSGLRIELLEGRAAEPPRVVLNSAQSRRSDTELEPLAAAVDHELLDAYRGRLYTG